MNINFKAANIHNIGFYAFNENGKLHILTNLRNAVLEVKILPEILACFGNYKVVNVDIYDGDIDASFSDEKGEVEFFCVYEIITDLPWKDYVKVTFF